VLAIDDRMKLDYIRGYGFTAIAVALLGCNSGVGIVAAALLSSFLDRASTGMGLSTGVPKEVTFILQDVIILTIVVAYEVVRRLAARGQLRERSTTSVPEILLQLFGFATIASAIRAFVPLYLATLGGVFNERSGVLNIGIHGMMIFGAWFGAWGALHWGPVAGLLAAVVAGTLVALIHAVATITFRVDHIVSGVAINILAIGLPRFLTIVAYGQGTQSPRSTAPQVQPPAAGRHLAGRTADAAAGGRRLGRAQPHRVRAAAPLGRREPEGGRDPRRAGGGDALRRRADLRRVRWPRWRLPLDRARRALPGGVQLLAGISADIIERTC
jgi:ABC-type uncharacterized transport system permease subunit